MKRNNIRSVLMKYYSDNQSIIQKIKNSVMVIFIIVSTAVIMINKNSAPSSSIHNSVLYIFGMIIFLILYMTMCSLDAKDSRKNMLFREMIVIWDSSFFFYSLLIFYSDSGNIKVSHILMTGIFLLLSLGLYMFILYYNEFFFISEKKKKFVILINRISLLLYWAAVLSNFFTGMLYKIDDQGGIKLPSSYFLSDLYYGIWYTVLFIMTLISSHTLKTKLALMSYGVFSAASPVLDSLNRFVKIPFDYSWTILIGSLLSCVIIFCSVHIEQYKEMLKHKAIQKEMQSAIMISQIQPHFMYNSLNSISRLCREDPELAENAVRNFSEYLKNNLDSLKSNEPVSFEKELSHIKKYLWLEQMRFGDKLKVEYDISFTDFTIPPLTVQPLVENSVKHGLLHKENGGTVKISSKKISDWIIIIIEDNGIGFDGIINEDGGRAHIGIENVRERIRISCSGTLIIDSTPGTGTKASVFIPANIH